MKIGVIGGRGFVGSALAQGFSLVKDLEIKIYDIKEEVDSFEDVMECEFIFLCVTPETLVRTVDGMKQISEINLNDKVLTHTGIFQNVNEIKKRQFNGKLFNIKTIGALPLKITSEHPILSIRDTKNYKDSKLRYKSLKSQQPEWRPAKDIKVGDILMFPKIKQDFPKLFDMDKEFSRLLGYYIAEGSCQYHATHFCFNITEQEYVDDIKGIVKRLFNKPVNQLINKEHHTIQCWIPSKEISKLISETCGKGCQNKHLPYNFRHLPKENIQELIKGIWRGDGHNDKDRISIETTSRELMFQIKEMLINFDIYSSIKVFEHQDKKTSYRIAINGTQRIKMYKLLNEKEKFRKDTYTYNYSWVDDNYCYFPVRKITQEEYDGYVYNLEVEHDNSYVANEVIVHNCLPTPMERVDGGQIDLSIIDGVMEKIANYLPEGNDKIIILRSTVIPGTTRKYKEKYPNLALVFNPEFLTERMAKLDFINTARIILGGEEEPVKRVDSLYRKRFISTPIFHTNWETAEFVKYLANNFFANKIMYFNEQFQIVKKWNNNLFDWEGSQPGIINWEESIQMLLADGRIGNSHFSVPGHDGELGFGGKCFSKDINAYMEWAKSFGGEVPILHADWEFNKKVRKNWDWAKIDGAVSKEKNE